MFGPDRRMVLTFHSISAAGGPTNIPVEIFSMQMEALARHGYRSNTVDEFIAWHDGGDNDQRQVLITFDDAFADFAEVAAPVMQRHGFGAIVFVPTGKLGRVDDWEGDERPRRRLMDWHQLGRLAGLGIEFGAHSRSHADLTKLSPDALEAEVAGSQHDLQDSLAVPVNSFAAPYGAIDQTVLRSIRRRYAIAFGTRLDVARRGADRYAIPRLDMHYFRRQRQWEQLLEGRSFYLKGRRLLRAVRQAPNIWERFQR